MARQEKRRSYAEMGNRRRSTRLQQKLMDAETSSISRAPNHETREVIEQPTSLKEARDRTNQVINVKKRKLEEYEALMVVLQLAYAVLYITSSVLFGLIG
ncbi:hypothetical protein POTOM_027928 [Populus tomentosa]|uniref:Transmembrane protein n=1 Tax=Populus tomentosa TaxID=118781 RepID=A0A8X7ZCI1_POPTO|nr:hypothetical protein POTOM_027928 [Populus tomentosa]